MSDLPWVLFVKDFATNHELRYEEIIPQLRKTQSYMLAYRGFLYGATPTETTRLLAKALTETPKTL